jgi:hypothetical protein
MKRLAILLFAILGVFMPRAVSRHNDPNTSPVKLIRVPNNGIQPQVAVDEKGIVHLVYFEGDPSQGNLLYVRSTDGGATFSPPIRVNSQPGSAIAIGNIRGARLAVGHNGRIHVVWNGSNVAVPKTADGKAPMLYSRLDNAGRAFENQRNLIHVAAGIDGGGAIAADATGRVFVFWHAPLPGGKGESQRRVWLAKSNDDGKTFGSEKVAFDKPTGVCGCCSMTALATPDGSVYTLFRSATEIVHRDMFLISSHDHGQTFHGGDISNWNVGYCVMSSESLAQRGAVVLAGWETEKQVFFAPINTATGSISEATPAPGIGGNRKYPALAINSRNETLFAWTEGMGWKKGGAVSWQVFDNAGRPLGPVGHADGVPVWSFVSVFAAPDGTFRIVY